MATGAAAMAGEYAGGFDGESKPPRDGLFVQPVKQWNATNLTFIHNLQDQERKEWPEKHHGELDPRIRVQVPGDKVADWASFMYGEMPEALTGRPVFDDSCCCGRQRIHLARHMYGEIHATAEIDFPSFSCMYTGGCSQADVFIYQGDTSANSGNKPAPMYKGGMRKQCCAECLGNETTLKWDKQNNPYMTYKTLSSIDTCKYWCCKDIWFGWRGSDEAGVQSRIKYDSSYIRSLCSDYDRWCQTCVVCKSFCCSKSDLAPRFSRSEDIRRIVLQRYDYEFAYRELKEGDRDAEFTQNEGQQEIGFVRKLPRAHEVDALFTSRHYHDVACGRPYLKFSNPQDAGHVRESAIDVRYRGSRRHGIVTEDDHLIVLAGLIMQVVWTFPFVGNVFSANTPAYLLRGYLAPRQGGDGSMVEGPAAALPTNEV